MLSRGKPYEERGCAMNFAHEINNIYRVNRLESGRDGLRNKMKKRQQKKTELLKRFYTKYLNLRSTTAANILLLHKEFSIK